MQLKIGFPVVDEIQSLIFSCRFSQAANTSLYQVESALKAVQPPLMTDVLRVEYVFLRGLDNRADSTVMLFNCRRLPYLRNRPGDDGTDRRQEPTEPTTDRERPTDRPTPPTDRHTDDRRPTTDRPTDRTYLTDRPTDRPGPTDRHVPSDRPTDDRPSRADRPNDRPTDRDRHGTDP
eukprot:gene10056-7952_t